MKSFINTLGILMISLVSLPLFALTSSEKNTYTQTLELFFEQYEASYDANQVTEKYTSVLEKIETMPLGIYTETIQFVLIAIQDHLSNYILEQSSQPLLVVEEDIPIAVESPSSMQQQDSQASSQPPRTIDSSSYQEGNKIIVAGLESQPVTTIEIIPNLESMTIKELRIGSSYAGFDDLIKFVHVYDEQGVYIASSTTRNNQAVFSNINISLPIGSNYRYITLESFPTHDTNPFVDTADFVLTAQVEEAKGDITSNTYNLNPVVSENNISLVPVAIADIALVETSRGRRVDSFLVNNSETNIALIEIAAGSTDNYERGTSSTVDIFLDTLNLTIKDNTQANNFLSTVQVERLDITSGPVGGSVNGDLVTFDLTQLNNELAPENTAVFLVTGIPQVDQTTIENIQVELDSRDTINGIITYRTSDPSSSLIGTTNLLPANMGTFTLSEQ